MNAMSALAKWLLKEHGGAPNWFLLATVFTMSALGITVLLGLSDQSTETRWTHPRSESRAASPQQAPVAVFIGDSYTAGAGGDGTTWTALVAAAEGWQEVNLGRGGTGFIAASGPEGCGDEYCPPFPEMVTDAARHDPDVVVVSGGRNDGELDNRVAIQETFEALREALPGARMIATSPMWDDSPYPASMTSMGQAVRVAVESVGGFYLDLGSPLEGQPELLDDDGVHPNAEGYKVLAEAVIAALGG